MAYGVDQQIGIGQAQVLPKGSDVNAFVKQLNEQKQQKIKNDRYDQEKKDENELNKIKIIGDVLDPRNFNAIVHDKLRTSVQDLAKQLKGKSVGDVYQLANDEAGKIGYMSDQFNQLQQRLKLERAEYEKDPNINANAVAEGALNNALKKWNEKGGNVDLAGENFFTDYMRNNPDKALKGGTGYVHKVLPGEELNYNKSNQFKNSKLGGYTYDYNFDYNPVYYDVKENTKGNPPQVTTKSEPSGIKVNGVDQPMLTKSAYDRYAVSTSEELKLDAAIQKEYGKNFDLHSEQADKLRRIMAYKNVDLHKPLVEEKNKAFQSRVSIANNYGGGGNNSTGELSINHLFERLHSSIPADGTKGFNELKGDEQVAIRKYFHGNQDESNLFVKFNADGNVGVYKNTVDENDKPITKLITTVTPTVDVSQQPKVAGKQKVISDINKQGDHKDMNAYSTDKNASNWKNNGDGTYTYIPTGQKINAKTGKEISSKTPIESFHKK